ncbi:MAG: hypothetical protein UT63_C0044G0009 [Candidatus Gottesmanbacteria bacterium GW2011_GWC2_39_8]|uniref:Uncharacterized protein n=1 Tax=Candidatus Gottesmanbacteria bacterium GW2011_GWC2_39_8 TaxID=1618450 RepID=A0A0G0T3M3_9BACT|nr:MAG: hypothetical protein UT63_C0044G0009 [Candidatus Gottesmanbacteria bacterium GW2011_GWC2_39_8]
MTRTNEAICRPEGEIVESTPYGLRCRVYLRHGVCIRSGASVGKSNNNYCRVRSDAVSDGGVPPNRSASKQKHSGNPSLIAISGC